MYHEGGQSTKGYVLQELFFYRRYPSPLRGVHGGPRGSEFQGSATGPQGVPMRAQRFAIQVYGSLGRSSRGDPAVDTARPDLFVSLSA